MISDWSIWISVGSMAAAWVAALFAYLSMRATKRQLSVEENRERRQKPRILLEISDCYAQLDVDHDRRVYAFSILLSNPSDAPNSIVSVELLVEYESDSGAMLTTVFSPSDALELDNVIEVPLSIGPRSSVAKWVTFAFDPDLTRTYRVRSYKVVATDVMGERSDARAIIVRDLIETGRTAK